MYRVLHHIWVVVMVMVERHLVIVILEVDTILAHGGQLARPEYQGG